MAMAMSRSHAACVVLFLGLLVVGCQGQLLPMEPSSLGLIGLDSARRILADSQYYISYGALNANRAPCPSGAGRSYYSANCQPSSGEAQPYVRSCNQITRCARG